jgi:transposase InsO family protein
LGLPRSTVRYESLADPQHPLRIRLRDLATSRVGYGYRRLYVLLRREGWRVNHKRVYRLYRDEGLAMRKKPPRRRVACLKRDAVSCFIATTGSRLVGFACYDATVLGMFGPIGVDKDLRGRDIGSALLKACLLDMRVKGYAYAVIGSTKAFGFYEKVCGADSSGPAGPVAVPNASLPPD